MGGEGLLAMDSVTLSRYWPNIRTYPCNLQVQDREQVYACLPYGTFLHFGSPYEGTESPGKILNDVLSSRY
jgi:hypothetical protein